MTTFVLDYGRPQRRNWRRIIITLTVRSVMAAFAVYVAWQIGAYAWTEYQLARESRFLLSANAPQRVFPAASNCITLNDDGYLLLPGGTTAVLAHVKSVPGHPLQQSLTKNIERLGAEQIGYTVVGQHPSGFASVEIWVFSRRAYGGGCGNSTWVERRRGSMRLWRNLGVFMIHWGDAHGDLRTCGPVSAVGY